MMKYITAAGRHMLRAGLAATAGAAMLGAALAAEPIRIMVIEPLSGPQSSTMEASSKNLQFAVKRDNEAGGILGSKIDLQFCDDKFSPKDGKNCLDRAIGNDVHFVMQGIGANVTTTLLDAIEKYNTRNPGKEVILINWSGLDEAMTGKYCSFWQFRTDGHIGMKMKAAVLSLDPKVKRVYLINMDYSMGQSADAAIKRLLKQLRPDIQIVGSELHPPNRVQDFTPYVAKIKATNPDAIFTANIGTDLSRLIRAGNDVGLNVPWYTVYASQHGQVTSIGEKGVGKVYQASDSIMSMNNPAIDQLMDQSRAAGYGDFESVRIYRGYLFLTDAIRDAKSTQPLAVAKAMEKTTVSIGDYKATMRAADHQAQLPLNLSVLAPDARYKQEGTPWGFRLIRTFPAAQVSEPVDGCNMKRPPGA
ncbi:amino acid/amide ABC transporter substrate-binding protein, HAAT family [Burkholderia sp. YR290]|jgi:branched-chain amino acid transport system substrate-binding protein|uniref:branched-chain amino acid ABC transporter substrate-binding protein n=1 Tax=Paraburkholderia hospita TaxID=169430 RepID=UPI0009A67474|nr:branched-chain amino acid ABC transporter substrate-binding protein [Paraburkholderia hospita]SKD02188.1 amino acid/amide ABC transporter substrate-binding protein, HAAT family [Paraburkholderia hospita]SOE83717.1 amino acid/amide ABC transporter substrate-binding protein, HAAT family [Burkholderia sp. YR290]